MSGSVEIRVGPPSLTVHADEQFLVCAPDGTIAAEKQQGYFCVDTDSAPGALVFNRTVTLRDTWAKIEKASRPGG